MSKFSVLLLILVLSQSAIIAIAAYTRRKHPNLYAEIRNAIWFNLGGIWCTFFVVVVLSFLG